MGVLEVFAANVRHYRDAAGLTQEQLAERAGKERTYIGRVEQGENLTLKNLECIAQALKVDPAMLLIDNADLPPTSDAGQDECQDSFALVQWTETGISIRPLDVRYDDLTIKVLLDLIERGYRDDDLLRTYQDAYNAITRFLANGNSGPLRP